MTDEGLKSIIVFLLEFLINMLLLNTVLLGVPLGWQILVLVILDSLGWWLADQIDW
jgi:hypothetical protein